MPGYEGQFKKWIAPLKPDDFNGKNVLDAGCGNGRNTWWCLIYGARNVVAFDFDRRTVSVAKKNLAAFKNATVRFGNIYEVPEIDKFDISHAIGVISHLDYPDLALKQLVKATKKGGIVLIWVLSFEGNELVRRFFNPIRLLTSRLNVSPVNRLAYTISIPIYLWVHFTATKQVYLQKLSKFSLNHIHSIVFDHMLPKEAHYYKRAEAINLLKSAGLKNIRILPVNNNSWTVMGRKR